MQDTTDGAGGLTELEERAGRLERRLARMRGELVEAEKGASGAEYDIEKAISSPNRKPRDTRPYRMGPDTVGRPGKGTGGGGGRDNPVRTKVKAATVGAIPGGLLGQYVLSVVEGRYGNLPPELDALIVALVAAAGAFAAGYYKRDQFSPPS